MDFTYPGTSNWDTDEITSSNPINYGAEDIFTTQQQIAEKMPWPKPGRMFTTPNMEPQYRAPGYPQDPPHYMVATQKLAGGRPRAQYSEPGGISKVMSNIATGFTSGLKRGLNGGGSSAGSEGYSNSDGNDGPQLTESTLMILLLVILVVLCSMIYSTVRQTCEMVKLLASIMVSRGQV